MKPADAAFVAAIAFLSGIALSSAGVPGRVVLFGVVLVSSVLILSAILRKKGKFFILAGLIFFVFFGSFHFHFIAGWGNNFPDKSNQCREGRISSESMEKSGRQIFSVALSRPYSGEVKAYTRSHPVYDYGEKINFCGEIRTKNGSATIYFPEISIIAEARDWRVLLSRLKDKMVENLNRALPPSSADLAAGLIFGEREFSKKFSDALIETGTIHLVSLSGYNILIIFSALEMLFSRIGEKRKSFFLAIFSVIVFVVMTGMNPSAVRAAIMAGLMGMSRRLSRIYSPRNSIALTASAMVFINPRLLVFDTGFQLSFLAFLGILYLKPFLQSKIGGQSKLGSWRDNALTTASAQLAVLPLLFLRFGRMSWFSILPNVMILEMVPVTMSLSFLTSVSGFVGVGLGRLVGLPLDLLLKYEINIVNFFARVF